MNSYLYLFIIGIADSACDDGLCITFYSTQKFSVLIVVLLLLFVFCVVLQAKISRQASTFGEGLITNTILLAFVPCLLPITVDEFVKNDEKKRKFIPVEGVLCYAVRYVMYNTIIAHTSHSAYARAYRTKMSQNQNT